MEEILAPTVYANAAAAGRGGANHSEALNAGVLGCLKGRLDGAMPLDCPYLEGTGEHADFQAGVAEGRERRHSLALPLGWTTLSGTKNRKSI